MEAETNPFSHFMHFQSGTCPSGATEEKNSWSEILLNQPRVVTTLVVVLSLRRLTVNCLVEVEIQLQMPSALVKP